MSQRNLSGVLVLGLFVCASLISNRARASLDAIDFERLWQQNNQRNLFRRYHFFNRLGQNVEELYLMAIDSAPDEQIETSEGLTEALISRLFVHYQTPKYLFLVDWFSAIPQPQETEGFTYGDLIAARTWRFSDRSSYATLGIRQKSTPRTTTSGSEVVFNAVSDATQESYSGFLHVNYHGLDFGTYYSDDSGVEAAALNIPITDTEGYSLGSTIYYFQGDAGLRTDDHLEVSLDYETRPDQMALRSGAILSWLPESDRWVFNQAHLGFATKEKLGLRLITALYYHEDADSQITYEGAKLGLVWRPESPQSIQIGVSVQQNASGDFKALMIPDETIVSFTLSSGLDLLY